MAITDKQLDQQYINSDGSRAFTADQSMGTNKLTNLAAPTTDNDAARKVDVDTAKEGLDFKDSVRVATTAAGTLASDFENGDTVDGVALATNDRILIKDQAAGVENGIHTVNASGAPTRADDFATAATVANAYIFAEEGTANAEKAFLCTNNVGSDVVGTDALTFTQYGNEFSDGGEARGAARTLGNTDSFDLGFLTNNIQRLIIRAGGNIDAIGSFARSIVNAIVASTTQTQGQQVLTADVNHVGTVANDNDVVTLPSINTASREGQVIRIFNEGANILQVFANTNDNIDGGSVDGSVFIHPGRSQEFIGTSNSEWRLPNIRRSVVAGITAFATGGQANATALTADVNEVSTVVTAGDSVKLLSAVAGLQQTVINNGAQACDVFPNTGDDLGAGVNTAISLAAGAQVTYLAWNSTNWV